MHEDSAAVAEHVDVAQVEQRLVDRLDAVGLSMRWSLVEDSHALTARNWYLPRFLNRLRQTDVDAAAAREPL